MLALTSIRTMIWREAGALRSQATVASSKINVRHKTQSRFISVLPGDVFRLFESFEVVNELFLFRLKLFFALNEVAGHALGTVLGFVIFPPVVNVSQRKREGKRCRQWKADGKEHEERGCQKWIVTQELAK